ncbi:MAG TPA: amidohydrolase family protein [Chitinophagaceae bacterium]|nr:amidohydrolase family protein [Chitinophagaceae bacterium]
MGQPGLHHISISQKKIISVFREDKEFSKDEIVIECNGTLAFPGLINFHDHLDFNLFPRLGNRVYKDYTEWGNDIHEQNKEMIDTVLKVPHSLRVRWGLYKSLLNGITTVIHHGKKLKIEDDLVNVQQFSSLHSPRFEKKWKWKLNNPWQTSPVVMHIGEGTNGKAKGEIDDVIKLNIFNKKIIAVHGVAMNQDQAENFKALVWCPASNYFLFDQTAPIGRLLIKTKVVFGTDSTLTASWNIWEQLRLARQQKMVTDQELFNMLTLVPAQVLRLDDKGTIARNKTADMVLVRRNKEANEFESFYAINPEDILLVMKNGNIRLIDDSIAGSLENKLEKEFDIISVNGKRKYVLGPINRLTRDILSYYPQAPIPFDIV